jgi:hypothetical protein
MGEGQRPSPDDIARRYEFAGEVLIARGDKIVFYRGYGTIDPAGGALHMAGQRWRLASVTKQVTAALMVMAAHQAGGTLDAPTIVIAPSLSLSPRPPAQPRREDVLTIRQLLTHHTGYANPDVTPADKGGIPSFYARSAPDVGYCLSKPATPGAAFAYNNCDYILAGVALSIGDRGAQPIAWPFGMAMALPGERGVPGFVRGKPEPAFELASWGAAGGLMGTARAVFGFDRALMMDKLMPRAARDGLWRAEGNGSYQALGAWVFPGQLKGCLSPKRIVQRDGEIYGVQVRNVILPDDDLVVIVFTNRSSDDFAIGEVWQGKEFAHDLLSAAACA